MITIRDIAKLAGVSITQVSRALNGHKDVSEETRQKVIRIAKENNYVPNLAAKKLATKNDNSICLIIVGFEKRDMNNNMLMEIMGGVFNGATERDYEVVLYLYSEKLSNKKSYIDFCKERGVSGTIICGIKRDDEQFKELVKSDFPTVVVDIPYITEHVGSVVVDNEKYSYLAVKSLIDEGNTNIGFINGEEHASVSIERKQGYISALEDHDIKFDENLVGNGEFTRSIAFDVAEQLINKGVDAIFCASDLMAIGALDAAKKMNLKVPEDISIFGFDGIDIIRYTSPPISTVYQDSYDKGHKSANLLINHLEKKSPMKMVKSSCKMKIRESSIKK